MTDAFDFLPASWSYGEKDLWAETTFHGTAEAFFDPVAQALYNEAFYNWDAREGEVAAIRDALKEYMWQEYDVWWDDAFDWDAWREAYDEAS